MHLFLSQFGSYIMESFLVSSISGSTATLVFFPSPPNLVPQFGPAQNLSRPDLVGY
ncbi:hypothetical protein BGW80DRAFT_1352353, partial [Lactifluus volemus]